MKTKATFALALCATLAAGGCAFAPGQHLDRSQLLDSGNAESSMVELVPITPKLLAIQAAAAAPATVPQALLDYKPGPYRVGAGDVLQVVVWEHPELSTPAGQQQQTEANGRLVQPDGTLYFPYVGSIQAAGKTLAELRDILTRRLKDWIEMPQVDVNVVRVTSSRVTFSGAFEKSNEQYISQIPLTLLAALGNAGIKTIDADLTGLTLKRDGKEYSLDLDTLNRGEAKLDAIYLKHGDHLHLPYNDRRKAFVMGEVMQAKAINFKTRSLSLSDALGQAGGPRQETADGNAIYVIRGLEEVEQKPVRVYHLAAQSPVSLALASKFEVQPQDVVFVGPAGITRWNRFISQLIPSGQLFYFGASSKNQLKN
ncbi:polysaccharide biosynthesis/export family protein [Azonexus sp.]|uniref:polysaccharide biosynthesis/export family protein n=1 Tax=Azonexus sp. TaxID=1872668 RepID=UPI0035AE3D6C